MKPNEPTFPSVIEQAYQLSPEAAKAQREAEMLNAHRYRAERMKQYTEWSDPVKRAERQAQADTELEKAKKVWADDGFAKWVNAPVTSPPFAPHMVPLFKPNAPIVASKPWYKRLTNFMKELK